MAEKVMEVKTILVLLVLNIVLPTLDTFTDFNLVVKLYRGFPCFHVSYDHPERVDYEKCYDDPVAYCSNDENNQALCGFSFHPKAASVILIPFMVNYAFCLIAFFRREKNKKFTFIFALLNVYPQFGITIIKRNDLNNYFQNFRGRQDHLPPD